MKTKNSALLIALVITLSGVSYSYYLAQSRNSVKGTTSIITKDVIEEAENRVEKIPEKKLNVDALLISLGKSAELSIIEITDTSYAWKTEANDYEILGKSIKVEGYSEDMLLKLTVELKAAGFAVSELNSYTLDHKIHNGFSNEELVCILRRQDLEDEKGLVETLATQLEIRCGFIDYSRVKGEPNILNEAAKY